MEINIKLDISKKDDIKKGLLIFEALNIGKVPEQEKEEKVITKVVYQERPEIPEVPEDLRIMPQSQMGRDMLRTSQPQDYESYKRMAEEKLNNPAKKKGFFSRVRFE